jgi:hypothetical protein
MGCCTAISAFGGKIAENSDDQQKNYLPCQLPKTSAACLIKSLICRTPNALCPPLSTQEQRRSLTDTTPECIQLQSGDLDAYPEWCVASA